jgi:Fe-S-cluster containining protein
MKLKTDLNKIKKLSKQRDEANWNFRSFLKGYNATAEEIDIIVHELHQKISSEIDCTACANCCRIVSPVLDKEDIKRFIEGLGISKPQFIEKYLEAHEEPGKFFLKKTPCPFLADNLCSNYEFRPKDCKSFPHLQKKDFVFRLWSVVENCSICPIVFNVYEYLKDRLWHDDQNIYNNGE